jgi:hypothetical protein
MTLMTKAHFHYRKGEDVPPALAATAAVLRAADCYIVCTPEYLFVTPSPRCTVNKAWKFLRRRLREKLAREYQAEKPSDYFGGRYNHTIAPGLTNTMNYFGSSVYAQKPSGIATYSAGAV